MNQHIEFLGDSVLYLRPVELSDVPNLQRWINDPEVRRFLKIHVPMNTEAEKGYVESLSNNSGSSVTLAIVLRDGDRHIGSVAFHRINWKNREAETGSVIGEKDCWSKGYGFRAKMLLLGYGFNELNLHRVSSRVYDFNSRSRRCLEKCGYIQEGTSRKQIFRDGEYHDVYNFGILRDEFLPVWQKYQQQESKGE